MIRKRINFAAFRLRADNLDDPALKRPGALHVEPDTGDRPAAGESNSAVVATMRQTADDSWWPDGGAVRPSHDREVTDPKTQESSSRADASRCKLPAAFRNGTRRQALFLFRQERSGPHLRGRREGDHRVGKE